VPMPVDLIQDKDAQREVGRLYELLCTARLNSMYYGKRIDRLTRYNLTLQIVPAVTSVTALAGLLSKTMVYGIEIWPLVIALSAVVTAISPLLGINSKLQRVESLHFLYLHLFHLTEVLILDIERAKQLTAEATGRSRLLMDMYARIGPMDETSVDESLCVELQGKVKHALPCEQYGLPTVSLEAAGSSKVPLG
jgi:hypothetical protein